ncbi:MAG TPA: DNA primase DnaG [Candidatus Pacearchaeota archaeon]|nr:DNA primase DnaG [Candidatus Pacearchaeota archaeon]
MAKISPVSIKYMIHANFIVEGFLEKPDVIGALFGQTEGLLGAELEMRELQKEGKIGRIEVDLEKDNKKTIGKIKIPTALDQSETALIAAAIETIERIGPCDAQIETEKIEDVRGSKREYIVDRAKKLMKGLQDGTSSREISNEIKLSSRTEEIVEYGPEKLPSGDLSGDEIIVVEGRADVVNLLRNGVSNVICMNGTKLPETISKLSHEKDLILFVDGDRAGKLIIQNVVTNARIKYIAVAPSGTEVEELAGKEILQALRKKLPVQEFLYAERRSVEKQADSFDRFYNQKAQQRQTSNEKETSVKENKEVAIDEEKIKKIFKQISGTGNAVVLDGNMIEIKKVSARALTTFLKRTNQRIGAIVIDGTATKTLLEAAEDLECKAIAAKNFAATSAKLKLFSF